MKKKAKDSSLLKTGIFAGWKPRSMSNLYIPHSMIFDTDHYYPFETADKKIDKTKEIFEFCIGLNNFKKKEIGPNLNFLFKDITGLKILIYQVLSFKPCDKHQYAMRVRCLYIKDF